ncbi:MAG: SOS response-associated peptidase family protein [Actinomycetota bacterium]
MHSPHLCGHNKFSTYPDGHYEWQGPKGHKTPFFFHHPYAPMIGFAGLYSWCCATRSSAAR